MTTTVPGVVIHHMAAATGRYLSCPSIIVQPDGSYLVSLGYLGADSRAQDSYLFRSTDAGRHWQPHAEIRGQIWSTLFRIDDALYLLGTDHADRYGGRLNGRLLIRRSTDGGASWSNAVDGDSGLLIDADGYHTAPVAVLNHRGRLWRACEYAPEPERATWQTFVLSAPLDADLLQRRSWTVSDYLAHPWSQSQWIEGNVVATPTGEVANVLRTNYRGDDQTQADTQVDRAAIVHVSADGTRLSHDRVADLIDFPGGGTKFTLRHDAQSGRYWALVNMQRGADGHKDPGVYRNHLYLVSSPDLRTWEVHDRVLSHPDADHHAFQYVDWVVDGDDMIYVSRTAYDDGIGGSRRAHDANFITFHRLHDFRAKASRRWPR